MCVYHWRPILQLLDCFPNNVAIKSYKKIIRNTDDQQQDLTLPDGELNILRKLVWVNITNVTRLKPCFHYATRQLIKHKAALQSQSGSGTIILAIYNKNFLLWSVFCYSKFKNIGYKFLTDTKT